MTSRTGSALVAKSGKNRIIITRYVDAPRLLVWQAHHEPEYVKRWWGLPDADNHITEIDLRPGGHWRFGQRGADGTEVIFTGEYIHIDPPLRFVYSKGWPKSPVMEGRATVDLEDSTIEIVFEEVPSGTLVTLNCDFSSEALRDKVAESGMNRMQKSYDRMDDLLAEILRKVL